MPLKHAHMEITISYKMELVLWCSFLPSHVPGVDHAGDVGKAGDGCCRPTAAMLSGHELLKQIHRKHNPPPLPELLRPLNPISATSIPTSGQYPHRISRSV